MMGKGNCGYGKESGQSIAEISQFFNMVASHHFGFVLGLL